MVRPAVILALVVALASSARSASVLPRRMGMYAPQGGALAMVDSKIAVHVRGPIGETIVTQTFRNDTDRVTEATYIFPLPADAAVSAMEIETATRTIHAAIESREQAQQRYERAVAAGVGAGLLDQERPDVFTQTVSAVPAHGTVTVTLRLDTIAHYQGGRWELVLPMVVAPRYVPGTASGRPTTGTGRAPDTDRSPDASRVTPSGAPGAGGKTEVTLELDGADDVTCPTHELSKSKGVYSFVDPKSDHDAVIRWKAKVPASGWVEASDDGGFAAIVVEQPPAPAKKGAIRVQLLIDRSATTRGDADAVKRPFVRALLGALDSKDAVAVAGAKLDWRAPEQWQRMLDDTWNKSGTPLDLTKLFSQTRADGTVVLVSDGLVADDRAVIAAAGKVGAPIHVIGVGPAPNRSLLTAIATTTGGTVRFATLGDDLGALARDVIADAAALPEPLKITWGTLQPLEVVPASLPRLGAGQAALVIAKVRRVQTANARVRNDVIGFVSVTPSKPPDGATTTRGALARRWAKMRLDELVAAGNPRAITDHALRYGLVSPYTSMVAIGDEVVVQGGVKHSVPVAVSVPEGMQWQLVKSELTVEQQDRARDERAAERKLADNKMKKKAEQEKPSKKAPVEKPPTSVAKHGKEAKPPRGVVVKEPAPAPVAPPPPASPAPMPEPAKPSEQTIDISGTAPTIDSGSSKSGTRIDKDYTENIPRGGGTSAPVAREYDEEDGEAEAISITGESSSRRAYRLALSFGAGVTVVNGETAPMTALTGRFEVGRHRTLLGLEGSLWLVDGLHGEGSFLASLTQRITRRFELGVGSGLRFTPDRLGPAVDLTLRTRLSRHLAGFLRYDGALLYHDQTVDGQNTGSVGIETTF